MASDQLLLQAALNGNRDHPALPRRPEELAKDARAAVNAGARSVHLHPYDEHGCETLAAEPCAAVLRPVLISLSVPDLLGLLLQVHHLARVKIDPRGLHDLRIGALQDVREDLGP